ncbi:SDR family oxidoreductase [Devosia rhizoryzae]|uniref:SDR family oxidoreductase n=1 Tax=Devosia rhizoryzae TaxID=2774137 RepID=A0ABX7C2F3_9HYPH|nr:SDR family oxidoreductase [Devosia rhizoryzae]QQR38420.1 SDR family oxidoreductase [Devosia rhizoryzae]
MSIENRAILVLGASRGLGHAIAHALSRAGFAVGVGCRSLDDAQAVAANIAGEGGVALPLAIDVTNFAQVEQAVGAMVDWRGTIAGLVNNAGVIDPIARLGETDPADWARLVAVNLTGAYHGIRAVVPRLAAGGAIVNISSGAASHPMEGWSAYCASKAALAMLTQSVSHEYGQQGILSYGLRPGVVDTGMQGQIRASGLNPVSQLKRETLLHPDVPAAAVAWLFSERPEDLSGKEIDVRDPEIQRRMATSST